MEGLAYPEDPQNLLAVLLGRPELESAELRKDLMDTAACLDAFKGTNLIDTLASISDTVFQAHVRLSRKHSKINSTISRNVSEGCDDDRLNDNECQV